MEITPTAARQTRRDLTILDRVLSCSGQLAPRARVRCGTPVIPDKGFWRPAVGTESPVMFAISMADGGERVELARMMVVDTHVREFVAGDRVRVADVQDSGALTFQKDPNGRYMAITPSTILLA